MLRKALLVLFFFLAGVLFYTIFFELIDFSEKYCFLQSKVAGIPGRLVSNLKCRASNFQIFQNYILMSSGNGTGYKSWCSKCLKLAFNKKVFFDGCTNSGYEEFPVDYRVLEGVSHEVFEKTSHLNWFEKNIYVSPSKFTKEEFENLLFCYKKNKKEIDERINPLFSIASLVHSNYESEYKHFKCMYGVQFSISPSGRWLEDTSLLGDSGFDNESLYFNGQNLIFTVPYIKLGYVEVKDPYFLKTCIDQNGKTLEENYHLKYEEDGHKENQDLQVPWWKSESFTDKKI